MKIHEYQARQLLADAGIPVPEGRMVRTIEEADHTAKTMFEQGSTLLVVKAQVHAGGRGKAGFVKLCRTPDEVHDAARFMFTNPMISIQTGVDGLEVTKLLVADGVDIEKEFYLAITTDRSSGTNALIASSEGGVEIETVAHEHPDAIKTVPICPLTGPWYSYVAPVSWLVANDVHDARKHLNFSEWDTYNERRRNHKIKECGEEVEEGEMPLWFYVPLHPEAELLSEDIQTIVSWSKEHQ